MAEDGQLARIAGRSASAAEPGLADLLDPIALEERLREARARRAEALARRPEGFRPDGFRDDGAAPVRAVPHDPPPAFLSQPAAKPAPRRPALARPVLIFLAGLGLGGAAVAVLALQALPERMAAAPAADFAPAAAVAPQVAAVAPDAAAAPSSSAAGAPETSPPAETLRSRDPAGLAEPAAEAAPPPAGALPPVLEAALIPGPAAEAPAEAPAADPPALPAQVIIHYPPSASETAAEARDALRSAGVGKVEIVPVRFAIGRSNIRYYHDGDRQTAAALAPLVAAALAGEAPEARDFTDYATPAAPGNVELWLAGNPAAGAAPTTARPAPAAREPVLMPGVIAPPRTQAQAVERILIERLRQPQR